MGKIIETLILPEEVIQHVQSFMTGKEAARSAILSKSWFNAWLTRPTIDFDGNDFYRVCNRFPFPKRQDVFEEFAKKTMQRYKTSSLKIESFSLRHGLRSDNHDDNLIVNAMKMGATHLQLQLHCSSTLSQEVLGSETLLGLSVTDCVIDGEYVIRCSRLKSLSLNGVRFRTSERFKDIMISCCDSLEELSLTNLAVKRVNLDELRKLRRLHLQRLDVDSMFFTDLASKFPCLKDLTVHNCHCRKKINVSTTSVQTISFKHDSSMQSNRAEFDVPNIRKLVYSGGCNLPAINVGDSKECEFDITITCKSSHMTPSWFLNLKRLLTNLRLSRISLFVYISAEGRRHLMSSEYEVVGEVESEPIVVENLKIQAQSSLRCALLLRFLGICRPKFIMHEYWYRVKGEDDVLYKKLMHKLISPNCGTPGQGMFGQFGLKKVNLEVYEWYNQEWRPLVLEKPLDVTETPKNFRKVRFELVWD